MKFFTLAAAALALSLSMVVSDAEAAKRLGGGRDTGMQRQTTTEKAPANTTPGQAPNSANATAAAPAQRGAVGLVIAGLEDIARTGLFAGTGHGFADHQRMIEAFQLARPGDHRERLVISEGDVSDFDVFLGLVHEDTCSRRIEAVSESIR